MLKSISQGIEVNDSNLSVIAENYLMKIGLTKSQITMLKDKLN
jgi:hypothetical protein